MISLLHVYRLLNINICFRIPAVEPQDLVSHLLVLIVNDLHALIVPVHKL